MQAVQAATPIVAQHLDEDFFRVRFDRLTAAEKKYLRAMAELNNQSTRSSDIAEILKTSISNLAKIRSNLIKKGMIYSPAYGDMAFTVPLFGEFMCRVMSLEN